MFSTPDPDEPPLLKFKRLKAKVLEKRPVLEEILRKRGKKNLYEYAKDYISVNINPPIQSRQDEFLKTFEKEVTRLLGGKTARSAVAQLAKYYYVSTADHHGPICHPFFINGNLMAAAPYFEHNDPLLQNVIVLACSNVSLNNSSYPRGLMFHAYENEKIIQHSIPFFPAKERLCPVFNFRPYKKEEMDGFKASVKNLANAGRLNEGHADKICGVIDEVFMNAGVLSSESYSDQITKINHKLWSKFFSDKYVGEAPDLIYLNQEQFVNRLILDNHIGHDTVISRLFFDPTLEPMLNQYFEGIMGAFSRSGKYGTYLFWALPKGGKYRIQLWKQGNRLVSDDGSYSLELTKENLRRALENNELIPSMMLSYMVIGFYYGLKCLGGFSQVNYLTQMKNAYIKMQVDRGNYKSIEVCCRSQTKEMCGDMTIAFLGGPKGEMVPATGLDLILYGNENTWPLLVKESNEITLAEAIDPMMPEFYRIIYTEAERESALNSVTSEDVTRLIKLNSKIKACVSIHESGEKNIQQPPKREHGGLTAKPGVKSKPACAAS